MGLFQVTTRRSCEWIPPLELAAASSRLGGHLRALASFHVQFREQPAVWTYGSPPDLSFRCASG